MALFKQKKSQEEYEEEIQALTIENEQYRYENQNLQKLLDSARKAKENDCLRGEYCRSCKHSVLVEYFNTEKCICTYGMCHHFEKEDAK